MADIIFGSGPGTGDTVRQALVKLSARAAALESAQGGGGTTQPPADSTPPVFQSANTINLPEGQALTHTILTDDNCTFVKLNDNDAARFTLSSNQLTMPAKDFEAPVDVGTNNTYIVRVEATNTVGLKSIQTITVNVTNVAEGGGSETLDPALATPSLTFVSVAANGTNPKFKISLDVSDHVAGDTVRLYRRDRAGALMQTHSAVITQSAITAGTLDLDLDTVPAGTWRYRADVLKADGRYSNSTETIIAGPDDVEPILSAVSSIKINSTSGKILYTTDTGEGQLRIVSKTANVTPTETEMSAGLTTAITSAGSKELFLTGQTPAQAHYNWIQHVDAAGNKSPITSAGSYTTDPAAVFSVEMTDTDQYDGGYNQTLTFANKNLGAPSPERYILVVTSGGGAGGETCTVGGVNLPRLQDNGQLSTAFGGLVPSGTTGDVVVTLGDYQIGHTVHIFRLQGVKGVTIAETEYTFRDASQLNTPAVTPAGGATIVVSQGGSGYDEGTASYVPKPTPAYTGGVAHIAGSRRLVEVNRIAIDAGIRTNASSTAISISNWGGGNNGLLAVSFAS